MKKDTRRVIENVLFTNMDKNKFSGYTHNIAFMGDPVHRISKDIVFKNVVFDNMIFASYVVFESCTFINCKFIDCAMDVRITNSCILINTSFIECDLTGSIFRSGSLPDHPCIGVLFEGCLMPNTDIYLHGDFELKNCVHDPDLIKNESPFIGYKYTNDNLVLLEIPKDAMYVVSTSGKCRCNLAKVVSILNLDGTYSGKKEVNSYYMKSFVYKVGELVIPYGIFNTNIYIECAEGIHFFLSMKKAKIFYDEVIRRI